MLSVAEVVEIELDVRHQPAEQQWNHDPLRTHDTMQLPCSRMPDGDAQESEVMIRFPGVSVGIAEMYRESAESLPVRDTAQRGLRIFEACGEELSNDSLVSGKTDFTLQDLTRLDSKTLVMNHRRLETLEFFKLEISVPTNKRRRPP